MMNTQIRSASHRRRLGTQYYKKVLRLGPIAYWPLWEPSGSVAECLVDPAQNGAYTGVTLGQTGIGDGKTCPLFDGANDYVNIYTTALATAFSKTVGTAAIWAKVFNAGVWTDSTLRNTLRVYADTSNRLEIFYRATANTSLTGLYYATGGAEYQTSSGHSETGWLHFACTYDVSAGATGEAKFYIDGIQIGDTHTGLGTWVAALHSTQTIIGARATNPTGVWHGWLAHTAIWDTPLTPAQIADLAAV